MSAAPGWERRPVSFLFIFISPIAPMAPTRRMARLLVEGPNLPADLRAVVQHAPGARDDGLTSGQSAGGVEGGQWGGQHQTQLSNPQWKKGIHMFPKGLGTIWSHERPAKQPPFHAPCLNLTHCDQHLKV